MLGWLVGAALGFYLLTFGLTRLPLHAQRPELFKQLHLGGWCLVLVQLFIMADFRVSLRGQWLDVVPFTVAWLAAGAHFLLHRQRLGWVSKMYFGGWFAYPAALVGAYLLDRIFFVLVSVPIIGFLPTQEFYTGPTCAIRSDAGGLLAPPRVILLTPVGPLLEKHYGSTQNFEPTIEELGRITTARLLPTQDGYSIPVVVTGPRGNQMTLNFSRQ